MLPRLTALLLSTLCALGACSFLHPHLNRPNISVIAVEMRGGNFLQQTFAVKFNIQNPNTQALPVQRLACGTQHRRDRSRAGSATVLLSCPRLGSRSST